MRIRRKLLVVLGAGAFSAPLRAYAQQQGKVWRIGVLTTPGQSGHNGFYQGLREHGYIEGKNILIERRFTDPDVAKARAVAQELAALKVDVIVAPSSTFVEAARQVTSKIPIVFAVHNDPVGNGHVASLARPGANITGVSQMATELNAKHLQLLAELFPQAVRFAVLSNPGNPSHRPALKEIEQAGRKLGLQLQMLEAVTLAQYALAFATARQAGNRGLFLLSSPLAGMERQRIGGYALEHRMPVMFGNTAYVEAGGLISYGPDRTELHRRAANYVDRILKGANPAAMPVEQPTKFELAINMKTAKTLGITIPQSIQLQATKLIE